MKNKLSILFILIFVVSIFFNIFLFRKNIYFKNDIKENSIVVESKEKNINKINKEKNSKIGLFSGIKLSKLDIEKIKYMCSLNINTFDELKKYKKENEQFFQKIFLGYDGNKYLSDKSEKFGLYFYNNCNFIDKKELIYGECIIRQNIKEIFLGSGSNIIQLGIFPFNFNDLNKYVKSKDCKKIKNNKFFFDLYDYCIDKSKFIVFLNKNTKEVIKKVCER